MQKLAATSKNNDNGTRIAYCLTHVRIVFENGYDKLKHVILHVTAYNKKQTQ